MTNEHTGMPSFHELDRVADDAPRREELLATVRARYGRSVTRRRYCALGSVAAAVLLVTGTAAALSPTHSAAPGEPQVVAAIPNGNAATSAAAASTTRASSSSVTSTRVKSQKALTTTTTAAAGPARASTPGLGKQAALPGVTVVDAITLTGPGRTSWDLRADVEYVFAAGPNGTDGKEGEVAVFAPSAGFTDARVQGHQQQTVDGRPAWFGPVSTWPTNGRADPHSGKQDAANPSLTWQLPDGWWVVLQSSAASPTDPTPLLHLASTLHITSKTTPSRVPLRLGYVPSGFATDNTASNWFEAGKSPQLLQSGLTIARGAAHILVTVSMPAVAPSDPGTADEVLRQRTVHGYVVSASGTGGVSPAEVQKILDGVQVADDPSQESSGWPTIGHVKARS